MVISQWLVGPDNLVKIGVHKFINNVDIIEVLLQWWSNNVFNCDYLLKVRKTKDLDNG